MAAVGQEVAAVGEVAAGEVASGGERGRRASHMTSRIALPSPRSDECPVLYTLTASWLGIDPAPPRARAASQPSPSPAASLSPPPPGAGDASRSPPKRQLEPRRSTS